MSLARIDRIQLHSRNGEIIASAPLHPEQSNFLRSWSQNGTSRAAHARYYAGATAVDPMLNSRGQNDADFADYWTVLPSGAHLSTTQVGTIGSLSSGFQSAAYCGSDVKNAAFATLGEIGRVHAYQPLRSLRLWAADATAERGHDADILDLFKTTDSSHNRGRVNINSLQPHVLYALFDGVVTQPVEDAVNAVLAKRRDKPFSTAGQLFGSVAGLSGSDASRDSDEEAAVAMLAELVTVRPTYYTVIACAQAIRDVGSLKYDSNGDGILDKRSEFNQVDVRYNADGSIAGYVDRILAEQKILAIVFRDAYTNETRVERYEYIE